MNKYLTFYIEFTSKLDDKMEDHFKKVDEVERSIEGMESSVDHLEIILKRIGKEE